MVAGLGVMLSILTVNYSGVQQGSSLITFVFLDCPAGGSVKKDTGKQTSATVVLNKEGLD